jgi:diguanylate cyclase (GGDEF)-like protein
MRTLALASVLTVIAAAVLVLGVVWWSALKSDEATRERLAQTVGYALSQSVEKIAYDQESVALWDDAVQHTRIAFEPEWVDVNLGVWMYDYFQHDRVTILDAQNLVRYAMADGKQVPVVDRRPNTIVASLASELREKMARGALDDYAAGKTRIPRVVDLGILEERPAIVSVMPLLPHSNKVTQEKGTEMLIVSARFLDSSFLASLESAHLLNGIRYSREGAIRDYEQSYPIRARSGETLGFIVWAPKLPGSDILGEVLPVLAAGLGFIAIAVGALIRHLKRTYTELVTSEAQARHLACHDPLTSLANRSYFNANLEKALETCEEERLALLFLDLDGFKQVNDTLGHAAGDALIRELSANLLAMVKPGDMVGRMGGDEFAIFMCNIEGRGEVEALCRDIVASVSRPLEVLKGQAAVGISIGIALTPAETIRRSELARRADVALYEAKRSGGLKYRFFTPELNAQAEQQQELEGELRRAIEGDREIDVVYLPIFARGSLEIRGAEALARWSHPRLGAVSPLVFVALAESCGLIDRLGEKILRRACETAHALDLATIAVNVSPLQFLRPNFAGNVLTILAETGIAPNRLEIEVTERALINNAGPRARGLRALRNAGVRIALDDFGTGQSSLGSLLKLEVDRIKIDRCIVRALGETAHSVPITEAMVRMAHAVGVTVTAEGVETADQLAALTSMGVDDLQGHLFTQPVPAARLGDLLRSWPAEVPGGERSVA